MTVMYKDVIFMNTNPFVFILWTGLLLHLITCNFHIQNFPVNIKYIILAKYPCLATEFHVVRNEYVSIMNKVQ